jgi:hypothetical protein
MPETREKITQFLPRILAGRSAHQLHTGVAQQNAQKLLASISTGSYNGRFHLFHGRKYHIMKKNG